MALRNLVNHTIHKLYVSSSSSYRQFSVSRIISNGSLYKSSLPILSTPWLMLPPDVIDGPNGPSDNYWNIIDKSLVKIDRPTYTHGRVPFNTICLGSARGWVAFDCDLDASVFLANPYSTQGSCRKLKPPSYGIYREGLHFTLVGDPVTNDFAVINEDRQDIGVSWMHGNDKKVFGHGIQFGNMNGWKKESGPVNSISRVAYNKKTNKLYELHLGNSGNLQIIMWYALGDYKNFKKMSEFSLFLDPKYKELSEKECNHKTEIFVVATEENSPSLFLVIRHLVIEDGIPCETKDLELYKIDLEGAGKIERVESIGERVLFLGRNSEPFFISARGDCSGLKSNCVYIADDFGFYDLDKKCLTSFFSFGDLSNIRPQAYWVAPPSIAR